MADCVIAFETWTSRSKLQKRVQKQICSKNFLDALCNERFEWATPIVTNARLYPVEMGTHFWYQTHKGLDSIRSGQKFRSSFWKNIARASMRLRYPACSNDTRARLYVQRRINVSTHVNNTRILVHIFFINVAYPCDLHAA